MGDEVSDVAANSRLHWGSHRKTAFVLRWLVRLAPVAAATIVVFACLQTLPDAESTSGRLAWNAVTVVAGFAVSLAVARFATRLIPMAALLRLSLVFPDEAPSRFKMAMKASSSRQLERDLEAAKSQGFVDDRQSASEQILAMAAAIGTHDRRTRGHSERVRVYSRMIGEEMGLSGDDLEKLQWGALLHDMGKIHVSPDILNKAGRPDEDEWAELQTHPEEGRHLLAPLDSFLGEWASASWGHHEKWDGSGYPAGLAGSEIPLAARIVAVADAYEVMTATRAYKTPMSAEEARRELALSAGTHFDPGVVRATLALSVGRLQLAGGPMSFILGLPFAAPMASLARTFARFPDLAAVSTAVGAAVVAMAVAGSAIPSGLSDSGSSNDVAMAALDEAAAEIDLSEASDLETPSASSDEPGSTSSTATSIDAESTPSTSTTARSAVAIDRDTSTTTAAGVVKSTAAPVSSSTSTTTATTVSTTAAQRRQTTSVKAALPSSSPSSTSPPVSSPSTTIATTTTAPDPVPATGPVVSAGDVTLAGSLEPGMDLSKKGPYVETATLLLWEEQTTVLSDDLTIDGVTVPAGTTVTPYYFSYSPVGDSLLGASIDLGDQVLAVASDAGDLRATDYLGPADATYEGSRKLGRADSVVASGSTIDVRLETSGGAMDQFRVLTAG